MSLKTTYRPVTQQVVQDALPPGWTEHRAPSGHSYYYNAETKQSTYTRPVDTVHPAPAATPATESEDLVIDYGATQPDLVTQASFRAMDEFHKNNTSAPHFSAGRSYQDRSRRENRQGDRPKSKASIPNCAPWLLVYTRYGRRFVHNPETKESFWKFPSHVMMAVIDMDRIAHEKKQRENQDSNSAGNGRNADQAPAAPPAEHQETRNEPDFDSDEYEEVEVTDDEDADDAGGTAAKRPRTEQSPAAAEPPQGPVEFDEDDIAFQLAAMEEEEDYGNYDPDGLDLVDDEEGLQITDQDAQALFRALLDDHAVNIFSTFDALLETNTPTSEAIIADDRWTILSNMAARRSAFDSWSRDRVAERKANTQDADSATHAAAPNQKRDPRVSYLDFLSNQASTKLYYPEFKRKFRKDPLQNDKHLPERDREKLYREYIALLKKSESDRKKELISLLKCLSLAERWRRDSFPPDILPGKLENDPRFWAVRDRQVRVGLLNGFVATLPLPK